MQLDWLLVWVPAAGVQQLPYSAVPSETKWTPAAAHAILWLPWLLLGIIESSGLAAAVLLCAAQIPSVAAGLGALGGRRAC